MTDEKVHHVCCVCGKVLPQMTGYELLQKGCGMDMGFELVYNLGYALWPNGYTCTGDSKEFGKRCRSNEHSNGDRNYQPHHHTDGGYAFRQEWI